jgi:hypothetical protein
MFRENERSAKKSDDTLINTQTSFYTSFLPGKKNLANHGHE